MINPAFLNPYFVVTAVTVLCLSAGLGFAKGYWNEHERYLALKSSFDAAAEQGKRDAEARQLVMDRVVADVSDRWSDALRDAAGRPVVRVLRDEVHLCQTGPISPTGLKPPSPTAEPGLGGEILVTVGECEQRLSWCAQDAAKVIVLQDFIKRTHEASK